MSKRSRLLKAEETSMLLLQQLADECLDASSSDDDDDSQIYANKFTELFAEPLDVPEVNAYVRKVVSNYSDKQDSQVHDSRVLSLSSVQQDLPTLFPGYVHSRENSSADLADEDDALIADYSFVDYREADVPDAEILQRTEHVPSAASDDEVLSDCSESFESDTSDGETGEEAADPRSTFLDEPE
ncbi:hypothetical protein HPB50_013736 [Hyalomma asiaticum]|uniref:Uncharacterized protein n=1 Tax=Hyalomma asiaticum TaxID=266040 RepID=A0ACB7SDI3_HYAAI|nr:hypothetical protein HPB50_013736 [Hyalomma asiaticum]